MNTIKRRKSIPGPRSALLLGILCPVALVATDCWLMEMMTDPWGAGIKCTDNAQAAPDPSNPPNLTCSRIDYEYKYNPPTTSGGRVASYNNNCQVTWRCVNSQGRVTRVTTTGQSIDSFYHDAGSCPPST